MNKDRHHIHALSTEAQKHGFHLATRKVTGNSHHLLTFRDSKGRTVLFIAPNSGHGHGRALRNAISQLRRSIKSQPARPPGA